ncbi:finger protein [Dactylonectria estremocensis]|uniref:Finger protein n=1 Tax=Dactylonectria estremocensis TaxID=1079267 RepID=A0A9P9J2K5_9HYPO|nr:finger protein [Dactylonectria estremocensis]
MDTNRRSSVPNGPDGPNEDPGNSEHEYGTSNDDNHDEPPAKTRKQPHVRSRASRACDRCKARKTRCSGKYPCAVCSRLRLQCKYTASYRRGRLPSIEMDTEEPANTLRATDQQLGGSNLVEQTHAHPPEEHIPSPVSIEHQTLQPPKDPRGISTTLSSRNSPEPAQVDLQGHYVGPASGASFLLRIQRKLKQQGPAAPLDSSIFTFGDLPLPQFDPRFLILPPRSEADLLIRRYFEFSSATHRFLHRPTVETWLQELYDTHGTMQEQTAARSRTALLFMVFAHAENFPKSKAGMVEPTTSARFFSAAEDQLSAEKGAIRLTSVQARLAQCFYLLSHSRLNHCWSLFGTTSHLMLALGIHRKSRVDVNGDIDHVDLECRKRTFWCAYNLDTYLSSALGRPRTFHDDDIDQELPLCVDDYRLARGQLSSVLTSSLQSVMAGSIAHIKLSRIVGNILRDFYGIRPPSTESQYKLAAKYSKEIDDWRNNIAYLVDDSGIDPSLLQPIFLRQRNVLNLACWHAQILIHRPFLLRNFASLANLGTPRRGTVNHNQSLTNEHAQSCLVAAMNIVGKIDELNSSGQLYSTFWFSHYFAFCAVVILYVFAIQQRNAPPDTYLSAFHAATKCQLQITSIATSGSLAHRYGVVLQELRAELLRHNGHLFAMTSGPDGNGSSLGVPMQDGDLNLHRFGTTGLVDLQGGHIGLDSTSGNVGGQMAIGQDDGLGFADASPGSSIIQMTGWGQFDSLVTGGMGDLQSMLGVGELEGWNIGLGDEIHNAL